MPVRRLSAEIEPLHIQARAQPVRNLCGHGVGRSSSCTARRPSPTSRAARDQSALRDSAPWSRSEPFATNGPSYVARKARRRCSGSIPPSRPPDQPHPEVVEAIRALGGAPLRAPAARCVPDGGEWRRRWAGSSGMAADVHHLARRRRADARWPRRSTPSTCPPSGQVLTRRIGTLLGLDLFVQQVVRQRLGTWDDAGDVGILGRRLAIGLHPVSLALDPLRRLLSRTFLPRDFLLSLCERRSSAIGHRLSSRPSPAPKGLVERLILSRVGPRRLW